MLCRLPSTFRPRPIALAKNSVQMQFPPFPFRAVTPILPYHMQHGSGDLISKTIWKFEKYEISARAFLVACIPSTVSPAGDADRWAWNLVGACSTMDVAFDYLHGDFVMFSSDIHPLCPLLSLVSFSSLSLSLSPFHYHRPSAFSCQSLYTL